MREIKFRAWDKKNKKMFPVHELEFHKNNMAIQVVKGYEGDSGNLYNVYGGVESGNKYELMQYTGLKDINGIQIYEGDILYALDNNGEHEEYVGVVEYDRVGRFVTTGFPHVTSGDCFVKGNIYENPELLK